MSLTCLSSLDSLHANPWKSFTNQLAMRQNFTKLSICFYIAENVERPCYNIYGFIV